MNRLTQAILVLLFSSLFSVLGAKVVVIDAGHGGKDIGGFGGKVYEKHLALDTAMRIEYYLKQKGYQTVMIRRDDTFVSLGQRARIANMYQDAIFISVHYNSAWKKNVQGLETFYNSPESQILAQACHAGMHSKVSAADRGVKKARYYVLRHCRHPAILVEGGFLSNASECACTMKGSYRDNLSRGIVDGIVAYDKSGRW